MNLLSYNLNSWMKVSQGNIFYLRSWSLKVNFLAKNLFGSTFFNWKTYKKTYIKPIFVSGPITAHELDTDPFLGLHEEEPDSWTPTVGKEVCIFVPYKMSANFIQIMCAGNQETEGKGDQAARTHLRVHPHREAPLLDAACDAEGVRRRVAKVLPVGQRARQNVPAAARPHRDPPVVPVQTEGTAEVEHAHHWFHCWHSPRAVLRRRGRKTQVSLWRVLQQTQVFTKIKSP